MKLKNYLNAIILRITILFLFARVLTTWVNSMSKRFLSMHVVDKELLCGFHSRHLPGYQYITTRKDKCRFCRRKRQSNYQSQFPKKVRLTHPTTPTTSAISTTSITTKSTPSTTLSHTTSSATSTSSTTSTTSTTTTSTTATKATIPNFILRGKTNNWEILQANSLDYLASLNDSSLGMPLLYISLGVYYYYFYYFSYYLSYYYSILFELTISR